MKRALEQSILSTLLNPTMGLEEDFDKIIDYVLDYKLFNANRTHTLLAKALYNHNQDGLVWDEVLIERYIRKKTNLNALEFDEVNSKLSLPFSVLLKYVDTLKDMEQDRIIKERLKRL